MLNTTVVNELRMACSEMPDQIWNIVGKVGKASNSKYCTVWSAVFGRSWTITTIAPPLEDPFPDEADFFKWYDAILDKYNANQDSTIHMLRALRKMRAAQAEETEDDRLIREANKTIALAQARRLANMNKNN
jgi:hypothetical protein